MIIPRLMIADERRAGKISAGVLIAMALKEAGYKLKLFVGGVDETSLRALQLTCGSNVTMLDPTLCGSKEATRWLFQETAQPDALNLIITELGTRWSEDSQFIISPELLLLHDWLECDVVPIFYGGSSSVIALKTIREITKQISAHGKPLRIHAMMLRSMPNPGEYELIEQEVGRLLASLLLGAMPDGSDASDPLLTEMCSDKPTGSVYQIKQAAERVKASSTSLNWPIFSALARAASEWQPQKPLASPIADAGLVNIAIIRDNALTLGGDGTETLMRVLGIETIDVPLDGAPAHTKPLHGIYIPHGLAYLSLTKFFSSVYIKTLISRGTTGVSFMLAEGGSMPLLGEQMDLPRGVTGGGTGRGFGAFKFSTTYDSTVFSSPQKLYAFTSLQNNPLLVGNDDTVWGYGSESVEITPSGDLSPCWAFMDGDGPNARRAGSGGFAKGRMLASPLRLEPWSAPEAFKRWLEGGA